MALGSMGLNDFNGRIQDAVTGRFLSADPYVPDPGNTQSFNRYSYALNNPMSFTDPSGFAQQSSSGAGAEEPGYRPPCDLGPCPELPPEINGWPGYTLPWWYGCTEISVCVEYWQFTHPYSPQPRTPPPVTPPPVAQPVYVTPVSKGPLMRGWTEFKQWLNTPNTAGSCGPQCAKGSGIPTKNTATNGERLENVAIFGSILTVPLSGPLEAAEGATVAARALTEADLGLAEGSLGTLRGTYSVANGTATAQIDMIEGTISNPFGVIRGLSATAGADGAQSLVIQGTIGNERLFNILSGRYGLTSQGAIDTLTIPLRGP